MRKVIHHLRKKPEHVRRNILHIVILLAGILMMSLWVYSLGENFSSSTAEVRESQASNPISAFINNLKW